MTQRLIKILSLFLSFCLIFEQSVFAQTIDLSRYFARNSASAIPQSDKFRPLHLRYISYDNQANDFKILLDKGDFFNQKTEKPKNEKTLELEKTTQELMKYFFIGLSLPNEKFWVNLRPDSPDNILDPDLEKTDIGRIFLEADLQLKKDTSSMTSPQTKEGKEYWDKLYKKAGELFGSENITIPTLTRPWIVPDEVIIRESPEGAYIYKATLKVMLEEDYLKSSQPSAISYQPYGFSDPRLKELNEYSTQLIKESIIPKLTKEINSAKRYAPLRQVYYSLILAQWFKQKYGSLGSARATGISASVNNYIDLIDSGNLANLASSQPYDKQTYFQQYQKSFKDGEYNLQEPVYTPMGQSIRRYMSGGVNIAGDTVSSSIEKGIIKTQLSLPPVNPRYMLPANAKGGNNKHLDIEINPESFNTRQEVMSFPFLPGIEIPREILKIEENIGKIIDYAINKNNESGFVINAEGTIEDVVYGIRKGVRLPRTNIIIHYHPLIEESVGGSFAMPSPEDVSGINTNIVIVIWGVESLGFFATAIDVNKIGRERFRDLWRKNIRDVIEGCRKAESIKYYLIDRNNKNRFVEISYVRADKVINRIERYYWDGLKKIRDDAFEKFNSQKLEDIQRRISYLRRFIKASKEQISREKREEPYGGGIDTAPLNEVLLRVSEELKGVIAAEKNFHMRREGNGNSASSAAENTEASSSDDKDDLTLILETQKVIINAVFAAVEEMGISPWSGQSTPSNQAIKKAMLSTTLDFFVEDYANFYSELKKVGIDLKNDAPHIEFSLKNILILMWESRRNKNEFMEQLDEDIRECLRMIEAEAIFRDSSKVLKNEIGPQYYKVKKYWLKLENLRLNLVSNSLTPDGNTGIEGIIEKGVLDWETAKSLISPLVKSLQYTGPWRDQLVSAVYNDLQRYFESQVSSSISLSPAAEETDTEISSSLLDKKGGIDLSRINKSIRTESASSPGAGGLSSPMDVDFDLNEELGRLQNLLNAQIIPSASRLERYARAASASSASSPESADSALSLVAETFRLQEEKAVSAPAELKALAAWMEQAGGI